MYRIRTRKFIPEIDQYSWWTTEFDNLKTMEAAVRCTCAHFVLMDSYGKIDKDIAQYVETMCNIWLGQPEGERPNRMFVGWEKRFHLEIAPEIE